MRRFDALRLKWHAAALRFEIAAFRHEQILRKAGFREDQARDELGRWEDEGGQDDGSNDEQEGSETGDDMADDLVHLVASRDGHHFVPRAVARNNGLSDDAKGVFEGAKTGPLNAGPHGWSQEHNTYNRAVQESLEGFLSGNNIQPQDMTRQQAQDFVDSVKRSTDPRIRQFNMRIYRREIFYWMRRVPRSDI